MYIVSIIKRSLPFSYVLLECPLCKQVYVRFSWEILKTCLVAAGTTCPQLCIIPQPAQYCGNLFTIPEIFVFAPKDFPAKVEILSTG